MQDKTLALCFALIFGVACNVSDPEANNADSTNNGRADMSNMLDMSQDLATPIDMEQRPDLSAPDDMAPDQDAPDLVEDMAPDMTQGPGRIAIDDLKAKYIEALGEQYCGLIWDCPHPPAELLAALGRDASRERCVTNPLIIAELGANIDEAVAAVKAGRLLYDEELAARCIQPLIDEVKAPGFCDDPSLFQDENPECELVFRGAVPAGSPCLQSNECASGPGERASCDQSGAVCYGTCVVMPDTGGNTCNGVTCDAAEYCLNDGAAEGPRCKQKEALGNSCINYDGCLGEDAYCAFQGRLGVCVARRSVPEGGACIETSQCFSGASCQEGSCKYPVISDKENSSCDNSTTLCAPGLTCALIDARAEKYECSQPGVLSARCYSHNECRSNLYCADGSLNTSPPEAGRCQQRNPAGKACDSGVECASFYCERGAAGGAGVCAERDVCNLPI
jgi:hypothetical protein